MASFSTDQLRSMASTAVAGFLEGHGSLTDLVVKVASGKGLTAEHVKRVCEMANHDAFEKLHRGSSGSDRYVSYDPPESAVAISRLRAEQVTSKIASAPFCPSREAPNMDKSASAPGMHPRKYTPLNAFDAMVKSAEAPRVQYANPLGDVYRMREGIREAIRDLDTRYVSLDSAEKHATLDLFAHAAQACRQGNTVGEALLACLGGVDESLPQKIAGDVLTTLSAHLSGRGFKVGETPKVASAPEVNTNHPLPRAFSKVASLRRERLEVEIALEEVRRDLKKLDDGIRATL